MTTAAVQTSSPAQTPARNPLRWLVFAVGGGVHFQHHGLGKVGGLGEHVAGQVHVGAEVGHPLGQLLGGLAGRLGPHPLGRVALQLAPQRRLHGAGGGGRDLAGQEG